MLCPILGRKKCGGNVLIVWPKDRQNSSVSVKTSSCWTPSKKAQKGGATTMASTMNNKQIPTKKRGRDNNDTSLTASQAKKKATKYCMLHGNCAHKTNECKALKESAKYIKDENDGIHHSSQSSSGEQSQCYNREELNTIIGKSIKASLKIEYCSCVYTKEHNTIDDFDA
eukprot:12914835-Ditylum_brightwellii.AAC.1